MLRGKRILVHTLAGNVLCKNIPLKTYILLLPPPAGKRRERGPKRKKAPKQMGWIRIYAGNPLAQIFLTLMLLVKRDLFLHFNGIFCFLEGVACFSSFPSLQPLVPLQSHDSCVGWGQAIVAAALVPQPLPSVILLLRELSRIDSRLNPIFNNQ